MLRGAAPRRAARPAAGDGMGEDRPGGPDALVEISGSLPPLIDTIDAQDSRTPAPRP